MKLSHAETALRDLVDAVNRYSEMRLSDDGPADGLWREVEDAWNRAADTQSEEQR